ncbi:putative carbonic anhydrase [Crepidotus variabilis]|uniref:Carbonic anhydrase n=1 Tax=Crepidotus variabilis TaxID=179855 RepID=A0A9P6JU08_9AGAR|nr:putative carbonic anhydrase [Crepidotus variabilis]
MTYAINFEANNAKFQKEGFPGKQPLPPSKHVTIVSCMDARIDVHKALGVGIGEAHLIQNAGGRSAEALRSVVISQQLLGTKEVHVIHHTDCGMLTFSNADIRSKIEKDLGTSAANVAGAIDFLPFADLDKSVREDVKFLKDSPLVLDVPIHGWVYQIEDGKIRKVK